MRQFLKSPSIFGILFLAALSVSHNSVAQPFGYGYAHTITILQTQVDGTGSHVDFPVLISVTDNTLRTTGNGGRVTNANGYDIVFYTSNCLTKLDHQIESYTAATGNFVAWVRIPTLSTSVNTVIHMYYGNASVSANPSTTAVWDSNYKSVWHLNNNSFNDNTSSGINLTNNGTTNLAAAKIAGGRRLNNGTTLSSAANQYLRVPNGFLAGVTNFSFEGWVNLDMASTNWERIFDFGQSATVNFFLSPSTGTGDPAPAVARITINGAPNEQGPVSGNIGSNAGTWIHWAVTLDDATNTMTLYRNGALVQSSNTVTNLPQSMEASTFNYFGRSVYTTADHLLDGSFDEFRISTTARSVDWISTSYKNQNNPATFFTLGGEVTAVSLCAPLPIELSSFEATQRDHHVVLRWTTASETNNEKFILERSTNGTLWTKIAELPGAGNSKLRKEYEFIDHNVTTKRYYYRLSQVDYDGTTTEAGVATVSFEGSGLPAIEIKSAEKELIVEVSSDANTQVMLYSVVGQFVQSASANQQGQFVFDTSSLAPGVYLVVTYSGNHRTTQRVAIK